jgi:hypothetical protein
MIFDEVWSNFPKAPTTESPRKYAAGASLSMKTIKTKIDVHRFLLLSAIKYLPAFVQNLQLKIHFSKKGMFVTNRDWYQICTSW